MKHQVEHSPHRASGFLQVSVAMWAAVMTFLMALCVVSLLRELSCEASVLKRQTSASATAKPSGSPGQLVPDVSINPRVLIR